MMIKNLCSLTKPSGLALPLVPKFLNTQQHIQPESSQMGRWYYNFYTGQLRKGNVVWEGSAYRNMQCHDYAQIMLIFQKNMFKIVPACKAALKAASLFCPISYRGISNFYLNRTFPCGRFIHFLYSKKNCEGTVVHK